MTNQATSHLSVRVPERDKAALVAASTACGVDASVAVRQVVELMARRFEAGADFWDVMAELKAALQPSHDSEIERRITAAQKVLADLVPANDQSSLLDRLAALEQQLAEAQAKRKI